MELGLDQARIATLGLLFCIAGLCASCGGEDISPIEKPKVVLVGIDGATWSVLDPMLEQGELPNLERLISNGSRGVLLARGPLVSPPIWTTIATGRPPYEHGIHGFFYKEGEQELLVDSSQRKVSALWNWMGWLRRTVGIAGWWSTWPAEKVNGWMLTDRFARNQWSYWPGGSHERLVSHPPELAERFPGVDSPEALSWTEEIKSFAEFTDEEWNQILEMEKPIPYNPLSDLKFAFVSQRSYEEAFLELLSEEQPDLASIFLIANDPICHSFWHYYEPEQFETVDENEVRRFGSVIERHWQHLDGFLGRLLAVVAPSDTTIVLVSDHGFEANPKLDPAGDHTPQGIWLASGDSVARGRDQQLTMLDIAPVVLRFLGEPIPEDLPGRNPENLVSEGFAERYPSKTVPTFEIMFEPQEKPSLLGPGDEEMRQRLESLGYLDN